VPARLNPELTADDTDLTMQVAVGYTASIPLTSLIGTGVGNAIPNGVDVLDGIDILACTTSSQISMYPNTLELLAVNTKVSATYFTHNNTEVLSTYAIQNVASKATPVDADLIPIVDSAASNVLKKLTWANLKTTLANLFQIKLLTGYVSGAGTVAATDTVLQAIQKLNGNDATNANLTGPITSVGNTTSIAAQTGTGSTFVMQVSPTLTGTITGGSSGTGANLLWHTGGGAGIYFDASSTIRGFNGGGLQLGSANGTSTDNVKNLYATSSALFSWNGDANVSRNAAGVVQIGTTAANALGSVLASKYYVYNASGNGWIEANSNAGIAVYASSSAFGSVRMNEAQLESTGYIYFRSRGLISSSANGTIHVQNFDQNESANQVLAFGPATTTSNGVRLKRTVGTTTLNVRNGDDSADASLACGSITSSGQILSNRIATVAYNLNSSGANYGQIYVKDSTRWALGYGAGLSTIGSDSLCWGPTGVDVTGNVTASGLGKLGTYTVATLPSASTNSYAEANVSDALSPTMGSTVAAGGSVKTKVRSNGTNWTVCGV
jgi:hypothetical protein